ncbi:S9 family peptidase [Aliidiomarina halalkaliphila]|uniref:S9 family peptidase n=1 Tax=Aliidiomarina halalkaliphila TaxID=2593535 RepID=A0A552X561_9GAMM|nr:S9 family peptidase [Aliidiomarina halalkaliphila]TRW50157.1 S9 family peptidase [Aliidiomarina halalkaliphila]
MRILHSAFLVVALWSLSAVALAENNVRPLQYDDVFLLEFASDPAPAPNGQTIVFVRNWMDRMQDRRRSTLWTVNADGSNLQALTSKDQNASQPTWSPDGSRIAYVADGQIHVYWVESGRQAQISHLQQGPGNLTWSPDGSWIAFSMFEPQRRANPVTLPGRPDGANWAESPIFIEDMNYRADGRGYLPSGYRHIYMMPAEGGTPIKLTSGDFDHGGSMSFSADGSALFFSANRYEDWKSQPINSEIFRLDIESRNLTQLTDRDGPDHSPMVSPDGRMIAFAGVDDRRLAHQNHGLYVMNIDGSNVRALTADLDQHIRDFKWAPDSRGLFVYYDAQGKGTLAHQPLRGDRRELTDEVGGLAYSRPYSGGDFAVLADGRLVFTHASTQRPAELAVLNQQRRSVTVTGITSLNRDLLMKRDIGQVEEFWYNSSVDEKPIHGWVIYPPGFDESKQYPMILEIHGGPHTAYGPYFAMELQLMAAQGYVVLYTNPRGSTSYGEDFANLIHHNYPSHDFDDLMDGVDAVVARGFINEDELFITGGSGGGVLTTWAIGHTDRFRAAAAINPVINWYSFVLNADMYNYFTQYWFPALPWEDPEHYLKHSPISYVGNVTTPTLLFTGESDHRTPISETEQYYQALQLRGIDTAMVRIPGASHSLHARPSNHMAKPAYVIYWFDKYRAKD